MTNYKELLSRIVYCASADTCDGCPLDSEDISEICVDKLLKKASDAIEQLCTDVARLEAENRAKEQYISETIGKVIKERDAARIALQARYNEYKNLHGTARGNAKQKICAEAGCCRCGGKRKAGRTICQRCYERERKRYAKKKELKANG